MNHDHDIDSISSSQQKAAGNGSPEWKRRLRKAGPTLFTIFGFWALGNGALVLQETVWVWPAAGIAIFAAVRRGYRVWWEVACGSLLISFTRWLQMGGSMEPVFIIATVWIAVGCSVATLATTWFRRIVPGTTFESPINVMLFFIHCVGGYSMVQAIFNLPLTLLAGQGISFFHWLMDNIAGGSIVAPLLLLWHEKSGRIVIGKHKMELAVALALQVLLGFVIFGNIGFLMPRSLELPSIGLIPLIWIAVRFERRWTALAAAVYCAFIWWGTVSGHGPYVANEMGSSEFSVQIFVSFVGIVMLVVSSVFEQLVLSENNLSRSKSMLEQVINSLPQAIFWKEPNGRFMGCNQRFLEMSRMNSVEEVVGKVHTEFRRPRSDKNRVQEEDESIIKYGSSVRSIIQELTENGIDWVDIIKIPLRDETGKVYGVLGVMDNITDRKHNEAMLAASEERFRGIFNSAPFAIILSSPDHRIIEWNRKAEEMLEYTREQAIGRISYDLIVPYEKQTLVLDYVDSVKDGLSPDCIITENITGTGRSIVCEWRSAVFHDPEGQMSGTINIGIDISDRIQREERIRVSEERFHALVDSAPFALVMWDLNCTVLEWNKGSEQLLEWPREQAVGHSFFDLIIPVSAERSVREYVDKVIEAGYGGIIINENVTASGKLITCEWRSAILHDAEGRVSHIISTGNDVTERLHSEEQIRKQIDELRRWHDLTLNREGRIQKLKHEVNELLLRLGEKNRYRDFTDESETGI